jgi:hypothetical protein
VDEMEDPLAAVPSMDVDSLGVGAVTSTMEQDEPPAAAARASAPSGGRDASGGSSEPPLADTIVETRIATHAYDGQDDDELTFKMGARISVIPFPDPDDQEEGWLYG